MLFNNLEGGEGVVVSLQGPTLPTLWHRASCTLKGKEIFSFGPQKLKDYYTLNTISDEQHRKVGGVPWGTQQLFKMPKIP